MKEFYHASVNPNLTQLSVVSKCHDNPNIKCAYVTDNYFYALFYIRDTDINIVTAWVNKYGKACYEEQFKNQLEVLYQNQKGCVYHCEENPTITKSSSNGIYYSTVPITFKKKEMIENVYQLLTTGIANGDIQITRFNCVSKERINDLYKNIADKIAKNDFYKNNKKLRKFYYRYYRKAWLVALKQKQN